MTEINSAVITGGTSMLALALGRLLASRGKSSNNLFSLYDQAMLGITTYTKIAARPATFFGLVSRAQAFSLPSPA